MPRYNSERVLHRSRRPFWLFSVLLIIFVLLNGTLTSGQALYPVDPTNFPVFIDDSDPASLLKAAKGQAEFLKKSARDTSFSFNDQPYSSRQLLSSVEAFIRICKQTTTAKNTGALDTLIRETFSVYQAAGKSSSPTFGQMLVTGYYEPIVEGSLHRRPPFLYPLYAQPENLIFKKSADTKTLTSGLIRNGAFYPYWTRAEIDSGNLLKGNELVFLKDPFEAFLLHVQGSGKIRLQDGSLRSIGFATSNGHPYRSIGKLLIEENKIPQDDATLPRIEEYLRSNPDDMSRVLHSNPRYIFFRWTDNSGPHGSNNISLTAGRSIAIDQQILPPGTICFLVSRQPVFDKKGNLIKWVPIHRFVFPQDSGAAIQGTGRVDLFLGNGTEAKRVAGLMKEEGELYFLLKK